MKPIMTLNMWTKAKSYFVSHSAFVHDNVDSWARRLGGGCGDRKALYSCLPALIEFEFIFCFRIEFNGCWNK